MAADAQPKYERLPGRSRRMAAVWTAESNQLYLADDHLVHVYKSNRYMETYKRFEYRDIQAIVLRKTSTATYINAAFAAFSAGLLFLGVLFGLVQGWGNGFDIFLIATGFAAATCTVIHMAFGPTCTCSLVTPVQVEALPSLGRWGSARRALDMLNERISMAQTPDNAPDPDALRNRVNAWLQARAARLRHELGYWHLALIVYALIDAVICALIAVANFEMSGIVSILAIVGMIILLLAALMRQSNTDLPPALKSLTYLYTILAILIIFASVFFSFMFLAESELRGDEAMQGVFRVLNAINMVVDLGFAIPGLLILRGHWQNMNQRLPDTAPPREEAA